MITHEHSVQPAVVEIDPLFCQAGRMRSFNIIAMFTLAALFAAPAAYGAAEVYRFDPVHTQIWFTADHQRFSHPQGRLHVKSGWFQLDEKDWSTGRVDIEIDMTSADMGEAKWSDMVRSGQFLDAQRWPTARFISKSVEKKDDKNGVIHGDLTLHGETKPTDVEFTLNRIGNDPYQFKQKAGFSAKAVLHRSDFGIKRYADVVGENIQLRFEIEGIADRGAARQDEQKAPEQKPEEQKTDGS
jgi:polyisoprenoid-binding protein YceI